MAGDEIGLRGLHYTGNSDNIRQILIGQGYQCDYTSQDDEEPLDGYSISGNNPDETVFCKVGEDVLPGDYEIRYAI